MERLWLFVFLCGPFLLWACVSSSHPATQPKLEQLRVPSAPFLPNYPHGSGMSTRKAQAWEIGYHIHGSLNFARELLRQGHKAKDLVFVMCCDAQSARLKALWSIYRRSHRQLGSSPEKDDYLLTKILIVYSRVKLSVARLEQCLKASGFRRKP